MKVKIAHIGDLHICGKNFSRAELALGQAERIILKEKCDVLVMSGDIFDRYNVADRYKSVGEQLDLFTSFLINASKSAKQIIIALGNHDFSSRYNSALEFLKDLIPSIWVIDYPTELMFQELSIGIIPWVSKADFYAQECIGLSRSESESKFSQYIGIRIDHIRKQFIYAKKANMKCLLFGHCDVQGTEASEYYTVQGGSFAFTKKQLYSTGADYVSLSHIHKRQGMYVGALYQNNFGEEGNPQGFEIITVDENGVNEKYIEIDLPKHFTVNIQDDTPIPEVDDGNIYKLRFYSEAKHSEFLKYLEGKTFTQEVVVEKLWSKRRNVLRTETPLTAQMSDAELLDQYMSMNELPEGVTKEKVKEEAEC